MHVFGPKDIEFTPLRRWRPPLSRSEYPVAMRVRAGSLRLDIHPLLDAQELDGRASSGVRYWEGAVTAYTGARAVGRGYLELTGYEQPLDL